MRFSNTYKITAVARATLKCVPLLNFTTPSVSVSVDAWNGSTDFNGTVQTERHLQC